ncbi:MAG: universal stress protein [Planctomycetales bacterium]|nr:universal stress protein [Planctomycetales bacterium]
MVFRFTRAIAEAICETAIELWAELIVIGTRGRSAIAAVAELVWASGNCQCETLMSPSDQKTVYHTLCCHHYG